ncbi:hypothetical protein LTS18_013155, partial [Coniosporium uncinatum]
YFQYVEDQYRDAGIVVPFINNDASPKGYFAPNGTNNVTVDIYGHDGYPLGFDAASPYQWPDNALPTNWRTLHEQQSPNTPYSFVEFQGGSFDPWGGPGFEKGAQLTNYEFERVFYKNNFAQGVTIFNIYMTYGGTNWGNLGHPGGYTSYDYGAVITEDRLVDREKYSEAKLLANFLQVSPAYLTANPLNGTNGTYANTDAINVRPLVSNSTRFYVVRQAAYSSNDTVNFKLTLPTSVGDVTIPSSNGTLTISRRDSKMIATDYDVGGINLIYTSADIFTWHKYSDKTVLIVYGGPGEQHEMAFASDSATIESNAGYFTTVTNANGMATIKWPVQSTGSTVKVGGSLYVYLVDRNTVYNHWVLPLSGGKSENTFTDNATSTVIVEAGYLLRTAEVSGRTLVLTGDINATTSIAVLGGAPSNLTSLTFNGESLDFVRDSDGVVKASA